MKKTLIAAGLAAAALVLNPPAPAHADFVFEVCPSGMDGVVAGTPTSCPFADNVRANYFRYGGTSVIGAYSPVTDVIYPMDCSSGSFIAELSSGAMHPGVLCTGGNGAAVVIW